MIVPQKFQVDFSGHRKDLTRQALSRMLEQHYDKCAIKQFVLAFMGEVDELHDALIDLQEQRTLFHASGSNLDALGRIVGEERAPAHYDALHWMCADGPMQRTDTVSAWNMYAPEGVFVPSSEPDYQIGILAHIVKNHTLTASVHELQRLVRMITDTDVSFEKTGPMEVSLLVPPDLSPFAWRMLTQVRSTRRTDDAFLLPYPATMWFYAIIVFLPERPENLNWFCADRENMQRCDRAPCAAGVPFIPPDVQDTFVQPDPDQAGTATVYLPELWLCSDRTNDQRPDTAQCAAGVPFRAVYF